MDCQPCQMDLWDQGNFGLTSSAHLSPLVLLCDRGGMTLPVPCIPWMG